MSASDESTGINLFDETASAVGNFPMSLRGYDRTAVDDYVRTLEGRVVQSRDQLKAQQQRTSELQGRLKDAQKELENRPTGDVDYSSLGARAGTILRMAEEQAREMLDNANSDANSLREAGRRDADQSRAQANNDGNQIRAAGRTEIEELRTRTQQESQAEVERAKSEATSIVAAAQREAEALRREAQQQADSATQSGYLQGEELKRSAESEAAEIRRKIAEDRSAGTAELKRIHEESVAATNKLLNEATAQHQQASEQLAVDVEAAAKARTEAESEAERVRLAAKDEAEKLVSEAHQQADRINQRTQEEFTWRREQLRRETDNLLQRKQAVLNQLQSLSALASQSASDVPDLQPLADLSEDLDAFAADPDERGELPDTAANSAPTSTQTQPSSSGSAENTGAGSGTGQPAANQADERPTEGQANEQPADDLADTDDDLADTEKTMAIPVQQAEPVQHAGPVRHVDDGTGDNHEPRSSVSSSGDTQDEASTVSATQSS
jgi:cell division septum initiation protein DivIVA